MLVVTAIHTFVAEHGDELEFQAGEKIEVLEKDEAFGDGWWRGRNTKGEEGLFPATYISTEEGGTGVADTNPAAAASTANDDSAPIPVPPSPKVAQPVTSATPPPTAPEGTGANGLLASPFAIAASNSDDRNRDSLLDVTGAPHSAVAASQASRSNVMGSTIGEVQEAIDTMATPKGVMLKDPQEAAHGNTSDADDDDDRIGIASDARARLAQQAKLANEERDRQAQRESGGVADLVYSEESDDDDEDSPRSPYGLHHSHGAHRGIRGLSLNGSTPEAIPEVNDADMSVATVVPESIPHALEAAEEPSATPFRASRELRRSVDAPRASAEKTRTSMDTPRRSVEASGSGPASPRAANVNAQLSAPSSPPKQHTEYSTPQEVEAPVAAVTVPETKEAVPASTIGAPETGSSSGVAAGAGALAVAGVAAGAAGALAGRPSHTPNNSLAPGTATNAVLGTPAAPPVAEPTLASPAQRTSSLYAARNSPLMASQSLPGGSSPQLEAPATLQPALPLPATPPIETLASAPIPHPTPAGSAAVPAVASSGAAPAASPAANAVRMPAKPPATWSVDEVLQWAQSRGFDETVCAKFTEHDISGDVLLELDANLLKELDIPQFGKRIRIAAAINELRRPASSVSGTSGAVSPHPDLIQSTRNYSAPPSSFTPHSTPPIGATSPVVDEHHQAWAHGRKVSVTPTTHSIDESRAVNSDIKTNGNTVVNTMVSSNGGGANGTGTPSSNSGPGHSVSRSTSSVPVTPSTATAVSVKDGLAKRESTGSLGHKRNNKGSIDKTDRLSFFGRNRKPPPAASPSTAERNSSRLGFAQNKPATTQMVAAAPSERRTSSGPSAQVGSALRQIGKPDKTGYLKKRGDRYNTWKTRFFVLKGSHLYYLKSENEDRVKGNIDLKGHRIIVDENTNPGAYGFRLVGPGSEKPHYFSSSEQAQIREWMKALMKATIARDYTVPVTSSCNIPTIPLAEAQALQPRPPSPAERDATQRANRRENVNQLTPRDASVLMSLDTSGSGRRMTSHGGLSSTPSRPSRDMRRPSTSKGSVGRPSIASYYPPEDEHQAELLQWVNQTLPSQYPRAAQFPNSFISGEVIFLLVKHLSGIEPQPPVPSAAFAPDATGLPNVEGLFAMMDCVIDAGVDSAGVSLNEIRAGDANAITTLLDSVRKWARGKGAA